MSSTSPQRPSRAGSKWLHWSRSVRPRIALGRALQEEGRLAEAKIHYLEAEKLQPHSSQPQVNLGWLYEFKGEMDEAEAAFRRAVGGSPSCLAPHARLASLLRGKLPEADLTALEERLADPLIKDRPRSHLLFGLAHVLDGRGDYVRAAECLTASQCSCHEGRKRTPRVPAD